MRTFVLAIPWNESQQLTSILMAGINWAISCDAKIHAIDTAFKLVVPVTFNQPEA